MSERGWASWEAHVNYTLKLTPTAASGSQWYEKGDGVDYSDSEHAYQVDAKFTDKASRSVSIKEFEQLAKLAAMAGKKFALPIRMWPRGRNRPLDVVVISLEDFADLVERAKEDERAQE